MDDDKTAKTAPEWVRETFGASALELGLYEEDGPPEPEAARAPRPPRPAWMEME